MPRYKRLKNIARNFSHSFMSQMNFEEGYYICDVVAREMHHHDLEEFCVDILGGRILNKEIANIMIEESVTYYSNVFFTRMLASEGFDKSHIKAAILKIQYDFENQEKQRGSLLIPFRCGVEIIDHRDKRHIGEIEDKNILSSEFLGEHFKYKS